MSKKLIFLCILAIAACKLTKEEYEQVRQFGGYEPLSYEDIPEDHEVMSKLGVRTELNNGELHDVLTHERMITEFSHIYDNKPLPKNYNFRTAHPNCAQPIRNQNQCGSCWSYATAGPLGDRFCLKTGKKVDLSRQDQVSCDTFHWGCNGGLSTSWVTAEFHGILTEECYPYASNYGFAPECTAQKCAAKGVKYQKYYVKRKSSKRFKGVEAIKREIFTNGPTWGAFDVYQDFQAYKRGIYKHVSGRKLGGHAIKMIGWGEENGVHFWVIENSYSKSWGEAGTFRMVMGDCKIDDDVVAGLPDLERSGVKPISKKQQIDPDLVEGVDYVNLEESVREKRKYFRDSESINYDYEDIVELLP